MGPRKARAEHRHKKKFQYAEKRESKYTYRRKPNLQMYIEKTTEVEQHSPQKFQDKKKSSTDVVEPVGSPLRNQIFLVFSSSCS